MPIRRTIFVQFMRQRVCPIGFYPILRENANGYRCEAIQTHTKRKAGGKLENEVSRRHFIISVAGVTCYFHRVSGTEYRSSLGQKPRDQEALFLEKGKILFPWYLHCPRCTQLGPYVSGVYRGILILGDDITKGFILDIMVELFLSE